MRIHRARQNFITRDHRYVYLGGSVIALLALACCIPPQSVQLSSRAVRVRHGARGICWFFLGVSAMALLVKWRYWNSYSAPL